MQRSIRTTLCILFTLVLSASLLPMGIADARGGGGGGGRGGGGGSRGGGASPSVNRSVSTQNRGNFSGSQPSMNRPQGQQNLGTGDRAQGQQNRQTNQQGRQDSRQTTQQGRQENQQGRQDSRQTTQQSRQGERTDRQDNRQEGATNRQENRQDFVDDNYYGGRWSGGGWYGGGYYVPPGWGWVGLTTGLIIGSAVAQAPPYYSTVYVGSTSYIYSDGIYMQPSGSSYVVVAPPVGAVVTYLPEGCTATQTAGGTYYNCSGIYYQPFYQNSATVYKVVQL